MMSQEIKGVIKSNFTRNLLNSKRFWKIAMIKRRADRSFLSCIDLSRKYYAAHGYSKLYKWILKWLITTDTIFLLPSK